MVWNIQSSKIFHETWPLSFSTRKSRNVTSRSKQVSVTLLRDIVFNWKHSWKLKLAPSRAIFCFTVSPMVRWTTMSFLDHRVGVSPHSNGLTCNFMNFIKNVFLPGHAEKGKRVGKPAAWCKRAWGKSRVADESVGNRSVGGTRTRVRLFPGHSGCFDPPSSTYTNPARDWSKSRRDQYEPAEFCPRKHSVRRGAV